MVSGFEEFCMNEGLVVLLDVGCLGVCYEELTLFGGGEEVFE